MATNSPFVHVARIRNNAPTRSSVSGWIRFAPKTYPQPADLWRCAICLDHSRVTQQPSWLCTNDNGNYNAHTQWSISAHHTDWRFLYGQMSFPKQATKSLFLHQVT